MVFCPEVSFLVFETLYRRSKEAEDPEESGEFGGDDARVDVGFFIPAMLYLQLMVFITQLFDCFFYFEGEIPLAERYEGVEMFHMLL